MSCYVLINSFKLFLSQALCDLMVEAVFPNCAIFLQTDQDLSVTATSISALKSGKAYRECPKDSLYCLVTGSQAEGLTLQIAWGHPWPDCDIMLLLGVYLGVNIPKNQLRKCHSPHVSSSQGCHDNGCLEYVPEGCPPAFAKIRVTNIMGLIEWNPPLDLFSCLEQRDGHIWLNTARFSHVMMQDYNKLVAHRTELGESTGVSGPAGQVIYEE